MLAPQAWARLTRVQVVPANRGRAGLRYGQPHRSCALQRYRPYGAASFSAERPICLGRSSPAPRPRLQKASGVIANGYLRSEREEWIRAVEKRPCGAGSWCPGLDLRVDS